MSNLSKSAPASAPASAADPGVTSTTAYCTFELGDLLFGVPVLTVQEVIRSQQMTHVPLAIPMVKGLINLRGQVVTAIDLRTRLGLGALESGEPMNVVVRTEEGAVSLLVDMIGDVLEPTDASFEASPDTIDGELATVVTGVYKLDGRLLLVLDVARCLDAAGVLAGEVAP
jgi:purine-binding chemotaxis protein CheW